MSGEIIRMGDPTSHGGRVIEGSAADICHGKPISSIGHQTYCPRCKGNFPIIEGVGTTTFYGRGVALAGMKTACGAILMATQFTDTVEYGGNGNNVRTDEQTQKSAANMAPDAGPAQPKPAPNAPGFDLFFHAKDERTGNDVGNTPYRITLDDGQTFEGVTSADGLTEKIASDRPRFATIEIPYYDKSSADADDGSRSCGC